MKQKSIKQYANELNFDNFDNKAVIVISCENCLSYRIPEIILPSRIYFCSKCSMNFSSDHKFQKHKRKHALMRLLKKAREFSKL